LVRRPRWHGVRRCHVELRDDLPPDLVLVQAVRQRSGPATPAMRLRVLTREVAAQHLMGRLLGTDVHEESVGWAGGPPDLEGAADLAGHGHGVRRDAGVT